MDDKYIFGLAGVALGAILNLVREVYAERRSRKKEAEYLAIRLICIFDSFMEGCTSVIDDDRPCHGQSDSEGYSRPQVSTPELKIQLEDVNWKSLPPELMYEILYFPNLIQDANNYISSTFEYAASPPDYFEGLEEQRYQYTKLGLMASELTGKLRKKYSIPKNGISSWDIVEYLNIEKKKINVLRAKREAKRKAMFTAENV